MKLSFSDRDRFDRKWRRNRKGCHIWQAARLPKGYGIFSVRTASYRAQHAHRVAWVFANGPIPGGLHVLHRCDTPECVNADHLYLGTNADNVRDRMKKGRGGVKLTASKARAIRQLYANGRLTQYEIGRRYGVDQSVVSDIVRGESWRDA